MARRPIVYGLDIETDGGGIDPAATAIVAVALSQPAGDEVFTGHEPELLQAVDDRLRSLAPGVLATWNGAAFDLPFLLERALRWMVAVGLELEPDRRLRLRHRLPGHRGAYRATWYGHAHLDVHHLFRDECIFDLQHEARHANPASDARLARALTERRWAAAARHVDRSLPLEPALV
jgi:DNA polymerase elongation subunit (family B)